MRRCYFVSSTSFDVDDREVGKGECEFVAAERVQFYSMGELADTNAPTTFPTPSPTLAPSLAPTLAPTHAPTRKYVNMDDLKLSSACVADNAVAEPDTACYDDEAGGRLCDDTANCNSFVRNSFRKTCYFFNIPEDVIHDELANGRWLNRFDGAYVPDPTGLRAPWSRRECKGAGPGVRCTSKGLQEGEKCAGNNDDVTLEDCEERCNVPPDSGSPECFGFNASVLYTSTPGTARGGLFE